VGKRKIEKMVRKCVKNSRREIYVFTKRDPAKDLGGKVVMPAFFPAVARRFSIGQPQNYRMHTRGRRGHTYASTGMDVFLASGISYEYL